MGRIIPASKPLVSSIHPRVFSWVVKRFDTLPITLRIDKCYAMPALVRTKRVYSAITNMATITWRNPLTQACGIISGENRK